MLTHLKVTNYALIRDLEVQFGDQFNVITGETGTGKSIIVGALGLIIGQRADTSVVNTNARKCVVEGTFHIEAYPLGDFFEQHDLDYEPYTALRREITQGGKSRAFINDTPVTLQVLRALGRQLVDIHSQHQTLRLNDPGFQLSILDSFAGNQHLLDTYQEAYQRYKSLKRRYADLVNQEQEARKAYDYYQFQVNELQEAAPQSGELAELEQELNLLSNAEAIKTCLQQVIQLLYHDEQAIQNQVGEVKSLLQGLARHSERLNQLSERFNSLEIELKDMAEEAGNLEADVTVDNTRLETVNERIQLLNQLLHKHGCQTIDDLLAYQADLETYLNSVESLQDQIAETKEALEQQASTLHQLGDQLTEKRKAVKDQVSEQLREKLAFVGIPEAQVIFDITPVQGDDPFTDTGKDQLQLRFTANRGSQPKPVDQVASGGELSRLMLCIKRLLADTLFLPTIIFDEIDMGISGDIAVKVGQMIRNLADQHQVVSITHLPQVAAIGHHHFRVYKVTEAEETVSYMKALNQQERIAEIAAMMAGDQVTETTYQNARELIHNNA